MNGALFRVLLDCVAPALTLGLENEVEYLWQAEQKENGKAIFNGRILSAVKISENSLHGCIVEYRQLIAQRARPELFDTLRVRPVAVSGLLTCPGGIVFGRRASMMTQDAGLWELVPSGGIDTSRISNTTEVDYLAQILTELHEETGINANCVSSVCPFCLVDDDVSHVIDVGIALNSSLSSGDILRLHREAATNEYDDLRIVHYSALGDFILDEGTQLVGVSAALIHHFRQTRL